MKKSFFAIVFLFATSFLFAEGNFNLKFGTDAASTFTFKPLAGINIAVDYTWTGGFSLGLGFKEYWNITNEDNRGLFCGGPYFSINCKYFTYRIGTFFTEGLGSLSLYAGIGGEIPIWTLGRGKLGLDFGAELWIPDSPIMVADDPSANNKEADPIDSFKAYLGVTYFLPLK